MTLKIGQKVIHTCEHTRLTTYGGKEMKKTVFSVCATIKVRINGGDSIYVRVVGVEESKAMSVWTPEEEFSLACCTKSENDFL